MPKEQTIADLRARIGSIASTLKMDHPGLGGVNELRAEWLLRQQEVVQAREAFGEVARAFREDDPAMRAAKKLLERAIQNEDRARENFGRKKEAAEAAFIVELKQKIVQAVPVLEETLLLVRDAVAPFADALFDASARGLPTPHFLQHVPHAQQALRKLIAAANRWGHP